MKNPIFTHLLALCVLMFFLSVVSNSSALLFDFESPEQLDDWRIIQGTWSIIDGELEGQGPQAGQPGVMIVLADHIWQEEWKDYTVEFKAKILDDTEDAGVVFRWQKAEPDDRRYYLYRIDNWPRGFEQKQAEGWVAGNMQGQEKIEIESDIWYKFKLEVVGNKFNCSFDDKLMFKLSDPEDTYSWGRIGFRIWNSHARYDDLDIRGPGIPGTAVAPRGKLAITWSSIKATY